MSRFHILLASVAVVVAGPALASGAPLVLSNNPPAPAQPNFSVSDTPFFPDGAPAPKPAAAAPVAAPIAKGVAVVEPLPARGPAPVPGSVKPVPTTAELKIVPPAPAPAPVLAPVAAAKMDPAVITRETLNAPQSPLPKAPPPPAFESTPTEPGPKLVPQVPARLLGQGAKPVDPKLAAPQPFAKPLVKEAAVTPAPQTLDDGARVSHLLKENAELQKQLDRAQQTDTSRVQLEIKNAALQAELDEKTTQINMLQARVQDMNARAGALRDNDVRLEKLTDENIKLRAQLSSGGAARSGTVAAEQPLRLQLRDLQSERDVLIARQKELQDQLESARRGREKIDMTSVGADKDKALATALRRSQEAEREVARLSLMAKEQQATCAAEKKQIEYMLFDEKLAKEGQIAVLNNLEDELARVKADKQNCAAVSVAPSMPKPQPLPMDTAPKISRAVVDDLIATPGAAQVTGKPAVVPALEPVVPPAPKEIAAAPVQKPVVVQPAPAPAPKKIAKGPVKRWRALQGASMKEVMKVWADEAQVQLIWRASQDFQIQQSVNTTSDYASAIQMVLEQQSGSGLQPRGHMYRDPKTGMMSLVITAATP